MRFGYIHQNVVSSIYRVQQYMVILIFNLSMRLKLKHALCLLMDSINFKANKYAQSSLLYGIQTAVARVFSAYGTGLRRQVIWDIIQKALTSSEIVLQGNGTESRDFIHVSDIAYAIDSIVENAVMEGEAFNVANGIEVSIRDLANLIISNLSFHVSIEFDGKVPKGVPLNWCSNISKLKSLGFSPKITLDDGIKRFTKWALIELDS